MIKSNFVKYILFILIILSVIFPLGVYIGIPIALVITIASGKSKKLLDAFRGQHFLLLLALCMIMSTLFSKMWLSSALVDVVIILQIILYLLLVIEFKEADTTKLFKLLNLICIIACVYGLYQIFSGRISVSSSWADMAKFGILKRIYSTLYNPNIFAGYLVLHLSFSIARLSKIGRDKLTQLSAVLASICLILTYSRGGFIALVAAVLCIYLFIRNKRLIVYLLVMGIAFYAINRFGALNRTNIAIVSQDSSFIYRTYIWKTAFDIFKNSPLFGNGIGTLWYFLYRNSPYLNGYVLHAHNMLLQIAAEMGILGLGAFTFYIIKSVQNAFCLFRRYRQEREAYLPIGFLSGITAVLAYGMVDAVWLMPSLSVVLVVYYSLYKIYEGSFSARSLS